MPRADDTLESIVHQATFPKQCPISMHDDLQLLEMLKKMESMIGSSCPSQNGSELLKKRQADLYQYRGNYSNSAVQDRSVCHSVGTKFCGDGYSDTTMMTWASFES